MFLKSLQRNSFISQCRITGTRGPESSYTLKPCLVLKHISNVKSQVPGGPEPYCFLNHCKETVLYLSVQSQVPEDQNLLLLLNLAKY